MERICRERALNLPNLLTMLRIGLLPAIAWRFRRGDAYGALLLYLMAMITDVLDGVIARKRNQITALGKLLDPLADKLSEITLLWLFVSDGQIPVWVMVLLLTKEFLLMAGSAAALHQGMVVCALPIGKVTTFSFILSMSVRFLAWRKAADGLLALSVALSFVALGWYAAAGMAGLRANRPA